MTTTLRASVTIDALGLTQGNDAPILVDGSDTTITAAGLAGYTPTPGDRLLVQRVGGVLEVVQFLNVGTVPYISTYRQTTDPALTQAISEGAIWYDTSTAGGGQAKRRESGAWVGVVIQSPALDIPDVRKNAVELGYTMTSGGTARLGNGVVAPTVTPTLSGYWPTQQSTFASTPTAGGDVHQFFRGLETHPTDSSKWITCAVFFGTNIRVLNKSNLAVGAIPDPTNGKPWTSQFYSYGGLARVGTTLGLLGNDNNRSSDFYIYTIDTTTWNKTNELRLGNSSTFGSAHPILVSNGTQIGMVWIPLSGQLTLRWYNPATLVQVGSDIALKTGVGQQDIGDAYYGDAGTGLGANTLHVALHTTGTNPNVMCWTSVSTTAATRFPSMDFPKPDAKPIWAMSYDTTTGHFVTIDDTGLGHTCSIIGAVSGSSVSFAGRVTNYDASTGTYPAGTFINGVDVSGTASTAHETGYSTTATISLPRRSWPRIQWALPPDTLDVDATHVDKANLAGVYISLGGGTMWRALYSTVGQALYDGFETFPGSGVPDVHDFSTAAGALGKFQSTATRLDGNPKTFIDGSGTGWMDGLVPPGTILHGMWILPPSGYLKCDGTAVSRTTFPDLFAATCPTFTGTTVNGLLTVTGVPVAIVAAVAGGLVKITGPGLPTTGTTLVNSATGTTLTISAAATTALLAGTGTFRVYPNGVGDGATTFNLPTALDRQAVGFSLSKSIGGIGGAATATLVAANLPPHAHNVVRASVTGSTSTTVIRGAATDVADASTGNGPGTSAPFATQDPYFACNVVIKT